MSKKLQTYIDLTRINKPTGYMLLFWPCLWGLTLSYDFTTEINNFLFYSFLFFLGSILMRSAGCIINDVVDRDFDKKVERTKNRPIASGKISVIKALVLSCALCFIALIVLLQFNKITILMAIASMPLAFTYPYMKRFTYWPQLYLGITFNYGLFLGWTSTQGFINIIPVIFYIGAIFWTLGYDTIYGFQDINDDEIIGVKSTSIKFKKNIKIFVSTNYFITLIMLMYIFYNKIGINFATLALCLFFLSLVFQIKKFDKSKPHSCLVAFKTNNFSGLVLFISILLNSISI